MKQSPIISIGIPTYSRPNKLLESLSKLASSSVMSSARVVVIDDGGNPATTDVAERFSSFPMFKFFKNDRNIGYSQTFLRIVEECETDYLMVIGDDDIVATENLAKLEQVIRDETPDLMSPGYRLDDGVIGRPSRVIRSTKLDEYFCSSAFAPGLIYRVETLRKFAPIIRRRIELNRADAILYPQVLFTLAALLEGWKAIYVPIVSAAQNGALPSSIKDSNANHYASYPSRIQQFAAFDEFISSYDCEEHRKTELLKIHRQNFTQWVIASWREADITSADVFENAIIRSHIARRIKQLVPGYGRLRKYMDERDWIRA